jgi:hypothetical protein
MIDFSLPSFVGVYPFDKLMASSERSQTGSGQRQRPEESALICVYLQFYNLQVYSRSKRKA